MVQNEVSSLDEYIVKKNIKQLTFGLAMYIFSKRMYGEKDRYGDINFLGNILPVVQTYKASYFNAGQTEVDMDLMLTVRTFIGHLENEEKYDDYFTYRLNFKIDKGIKGLKIAGLDKGNLMREFDKKNSLRPNLTPYLYDEYKEDVAEEFLKKYCPEALTTPIPLQVENIASQMGLSILETALPDNVKGMITFRRGSVYPIDDSSKICDQGTIVVNENIDHHFNYGTVNNTVIHECVHWWLHRKYMELRMLLHGEDTALICPVDSEFNESIGEELFFIENQARTLAPLILMPRESSIAKFEELLFNQRMNGGNERTVYENSLEKFADYFGVSYSAAKSRLEKLGYNEVLKNGINIKVKERNSTRFISYWEFCQIPVDSKIGEMLERRQLVYADGFIVPNFEELVKYGRDNKPELTDYATKHILEFAIPFDVKWKETVTTDGQYLFHSLYSSGSVTRRVTMNDGAVDFVLKAYKNADQSKPVVKEFFRTFRFDDTVMLTTLKYSEYLCTLMDRHEVSIRELADKAGVSKSTVDKYRRYQESPYAEDKTLRLCIGMNAYPYETLNLLRLRGTILEPAITDRNKLYHKLVTEHYDKDLKFWLEYIKDKDPKAL